MSNWRYDHGDFSKLLTHLPSDVPLCRSEVYKNSAPDAKIKNMHLLGYKDGVIIISIECKQKADATALAASFPEHSSEIVCEQGDMPHDEKDVTIKLQPTADSRQKINLSRALEAINNFELIEPMAVFVRMKKALGLDLSESIGTYATQIQTLYADGNFDAALTLALRCKEAGMPGLVHGLAQRCLEANDYENIIKAIPYESDPASIYEFAFQLFTAVEVDGVTSRRDKLKIAMKLFDLCGELNDSMTLKTQIFSELTGKSFDGTFIELATHLHGDNLCQVVDVLFMQNREMDKLKAVSGSSSHHAVSSTVMRSFSGGASGGSKSDASTQTDEDGSSPK